MDKRDEEYAEIFSSVFEGYSKGTAPMIDRRDDPKHAHFFWGFLNLEKPNNFLVFSAAVGKKKNKNGMKLVRDDELRVRK